MARQYSNTTNLTTLVSSIDASQVNIVVNDTSGFPVSFPYSLILDYQGPSVEVVTVTNLSGSTLTVVRGQDGTAASAHDAGTVVAHGVTARDLAEPQQHIDATASVHGLAPGSSLVGTGMTQTLTNKTISIADNAMPGVVSLTGAQTLTNKTIDVADNSIVGVVTPAGTQTLTNKTIAFASNTLTGVASTGTSQTLTNKTIAASNNTLQIALGNLSNVSVASPANGAFLTFNTTGSNWTATTTPVPVVSENASNIVVSNTTFAAGTPVVGHVFQAPASGIVEVHLYADFRMDLSQSNARIAFLSYEIRQSNTVGSGVVVVEASTDRSVSIGIGGSSGLVNLLRAGITEKHVLTPGQTYNIRTMHATNTGTGHTTDLRLRRVTTSVLR